MIIYLKYHITVKIWNVLINILQTLIKNINGEINKIPPSFIFLITITYYFWVRLFLHNLWYTSSPS